MPLSNQVDEANGSANSIGAVAPKHDKFWVACMRKIGIFPLLVCMYGGYYLSDVWGSNFETIGYGILCSILVFGFAVLLAIRALLGTRSDSSASSHVRLDAVAIGVFGLLLIFGIAVQWVGFFYAALPLSIALLLTMNYRRPLPVLALAVSLTLLAYLVLDVLLGVPLPAPLWSS